MTKMIPLTQGKVALVDDDVYPWINQYRWHFKNGYASRHVRVNGKQLTLDMQRVIMETPDGFETDHIDGNPLNNQRSNLRICTKEQNQRNRKPLNRTSRFKGVHWNERRNRWVASIGIGKRVIGLGGYIREEDAARAYDRAAVEYFGEFARLNFPELDPWEIPLFKPHKLTSKCSGVSYKSSRNKWEVQIYVKGRKIYIGSFKTEEEAIAARVAAQEEYRNDYKRPPRLDV